MIYQGGVSGIHSEMCPIFMASDFKKVTWQQQKSLSLRFHGGIFQVQPTVKLVWVEILIFRF